MSKQFSSLSALIAEDDSTCLRIVVKYLENLGLKRIVGVKSGEEAITQLSSAAEPFDLVISDIEMPGMDGFELARQIRSGVVPRYKDVPLFMLTSHSDFDNVRQSRTHRIQGFIVKPPNAEILERNLARVLAGK